MDDRRQAGEQRRHDSGETAGEAAGALSGLTAGGALGSLAGPLGTVIGAVAGAVGGWWAVHAATEAHTRLTPERESEFRERHARRPADVPPVPFERARLAYHLGFVAGCNPRYVEEGYAAAEQELRLGWAAGLESDIGRWDEYREFVRAGFEHAREAHEPEGRAEPAHGSGVEPLHADPATEAANRVHERLAERRRPGG
ncbi:MAG TPA: hypothetical protein VK922_06670 [Gemmatimonadaceae bacterium]|nr:hypothetical protein [Gemmatimonadaceae bacterium]